MRRRGSPGQPYRRCWPTGSEIESGSNRLFINFPSVCWGRGARRAELGAISHAYAPSPSSLPAHTPAPYLEAGWGAGGGGGGTFCPFAEEGEKAS